MSDWDNKHTQPFSLEAFNEARKRMEEIIIYPPPIIIPLWLYELGEKIGLIKDGELTRMAASLEIPRKDITYVVKRFKRQDKNPCCCPSVLFFIEGITAETEAEAKRLANLGCVVEHEWELLD